MPLPQGYIREQRETEDQKYKTVAELRVNKDETKTACKDLGREQEANEFVTPKGVLHLAKCDASATRKGL